MSGRVLPCGERAVLAEVDSLAEVLALHRRLWVQDRPAGLADAVAGARTLLLVATGPDALGPVTAHLRGALDELSAERPGLPMGERGAPAGDGGSPPDRQASDAVVEVAVHYDGPDLDDVAAMTGLTPAEVVAAHIGRPWVVGFAGFAPGFAYLVGGDPRLHVPRRDTPRTRVPAGAVGLAGEFSGIYPRPSPGGWQLVGHTDTRMWDLDRDPPALLRPGMRVQFVDADGDR